MSSFKKTNFSLEEIPDYAIAVGLVVLTVVLRYITLEYVEIGGDSINVWNHYSNFVGTGRPIGWDHQTMRWGIGLPLYLVLKIFGTVIPNYYILPVFFSAVATALFYYLVRQLRSRSFSAFAVGMLVFYPLMPTMGSQLWPGLYEMTYLLGCVLALLVWRDKGRWQLLAVAGLLAGCAWGSRMTSIYYAPGILALLVFDKRRFSPVLIFSSFFLLIVALEWSFFYGQSGNILGRIGIMESTHVTRDELLLTFSSYLLNCRNLIKFRGLLPVVLGALFVGAWLIRRGKSNEKSIAILYVGGLFFNIYMISSLSPLKLAAPVGSRYLTAAVPYMILVLLFGFEYLSRSHARISKYLRRVLFLAFVGFTLSHVPAQNSFSRIKEDAANAKIITDNNLPVLMRYTSWHPNIIEKTAMSLVGYEAKSRLKINEDGKMMKNANRLQVMSFGEPATNDYVPHSIDGYYYFYRGDAELLRNARMVGISDFARKTHKLVIVPADSLPQKITRGLN